jgi:hypothetical protein
VYDYNGWIFGTFDGVWTKYSVKDAVFLSDLYPVSIAVRAGYVYASFCACHTGDCKGGLMR